MKKCESCTSCGMPFKSSSDHALGMDSVPFCTHCADDKGVLRPFEEVLEATTGYFVRSQGLDPQAAQRMAVNLLKSQPAWISKK